MAIGGSEPISELEALQLKANSITDESLESTRRMIQLVEEVFSIVNFSSNNSYIAMYKELSNLLNSPFLNLRGPRNE